MTLDKIEYKLRYHWKTAATIQCDIYAVDEDHYPTGLSLGQALHPAISNYPEWESIAFTFDPPVDLAAGVEYAAILYSPESTDNKVYDFAFQSSATYEEGGRLVTYEESWIFYGPFRDDHCFKIYSGENVIEEYDADCLSYQRFGSVRKAGQTFELAEAAPPSGLLCNGATNPSDIYPEYFSAICNEESAASYYRIQVNKSSDFSGRMVWDSGKATLITPVNPEERCENISYNGQTLSNNGITYYWRIKFWNAADEEGDWSE